MSANLITVRIWEELTMAAKSARQPCHVAVAYFAFGADQLLPLPAGSRLVVNASVRAVSSGQTSPAALARLLESGVKVYTVANLHAKVFVMGTTTYVGSTNVSSNSQGHLLEAVLRSTDASVVLSARAFVKGLCLNELTPRMLEKLESLYVPPKFSHLKGSKRKDNKPANLPEIAPLRIVRLKDVEWSDWDQANIEDGEFDAECNRKHDDGFRMDHFKWAGPCAIEEGDMVIRILTGRDGHVFVYPPGNVIKKDTRKKSGKSVSYLYVECPDRRRRTLPAWTRKLGGDVDKVIRRSGIIRDPAMARKLLKSWEG